MSLKCGTATISSSDDFTSFKWMDANDDGFATREEITNYFKKSGAEIFEEGASQKLAKQFIKTLDIDGNGKISLGECALGSMNSSEINWANFEKKYAIHTTDNFFAQYDTNKDGTITQEEIKEVDKLNDKSKGLSTGAIVGIVIGAVCLVGLIVGLVVYFSRKNKKEAQKDENNKNKEKSNGNHIDHEQKQIGYNTQNNLDSVNKQKDKDQSVIR